VILDFQMKSHERYLKKFIMHFKQVDHDSNGILDESEFRQLLSNVNIGVSEMEV
jgi:Ca2+-binding EF-hand superfamily protein